MNKKSVIAMTMMVVLLLLVVGCGSTNSKTSNTNIRENTNSGKGKVNIVRSPVSDVTKPIIVMHQGDQAILDAFPESMNDEVFIPVQNVCQILGAQLEWDEKTNVATISRTGSQVKMTIGNKQADVKGSPKSMEIAPYLKQNQRMVPTVMICKAFGVPVDFNDHDGVLYIDSPHSKGLKLQRFKRIDNEAFYKLIDLRNTVVTADMLVLDERNNWRTVPRDLILVGLEEQGRFLVFKDTWSGAYDQFPSLSVSLSVKVIWEDGFAKEYSDRSSFKLRAGDNFSDGSAPSIWFDNQLNYYSLDSTIKMGANMNRIAQIWGGHYDLDLQGYDRSWQESHGNVVRIDCNGKTIFDIDPQKRLYFANEIPVLASGNVLPINQSFKLGNCTLNVKSMDIRDMTYDESAGWHEKITKPNCGVLCMSVKPDVDTFNHYTYEVYDTYHRYGKKIATDYKFSNREGFYAGVQKEYSVQSTVVPIIDCDKISVTITDDETNQSKTLTIPLSK